MPNEDVIPDVVAMLDSLVEKKTFSLDAMTAIQKLKERAGFDAKDLQRTKYDLAATIRERDNYQSKYEKFFKREAELTARENILTTLERDVAVAKAVQGAYKDMFDRMFANRQTRELINTQNWVPNPSPSGGYPVPMTDTKDITKREE